MTEEPKDKGQKKNPRPTNCSQCNKRLDKKKMYYRNGKYYCNKRCFKTSIKPKPAS